MADDHRRQQRIRERAYELWENAGKPEGQDDHFWHTAEVEIDAQDQATPATKSS